MAKLTEKEISELAQAELNHVMGFIAELAAATDLDDNIESVAGLQLYNALLAAYSAGFGRAVKSSQEHEKRVARAYAEACGADAEALAQELYERFNPNAN